MIKDHQKQVLEVEARIRGVLEEYFEKIGFVDTRKIDFLFGYIGVLVARLVDRGDIDLMTANQNMLETFKKITDFVNKTPPKPQGCKESAHKNEKL